MVEGARSTLEELAEAIDAARIGVDRDELVAAHTLLDRLAAKVLAADAAFDTAELWDTCGATSLTRWLVAECRMNDAAALRQARAAKRTAALPAVAAAHESGELSAGQIELIASWVRPCHVPLFADHEHALVPALAALDIDATVSVLRDWTQKADAVLDGTEPAARRRSSLRLHTVLDDYGQLDAQLTLDDHAVVVEALRGARRRDDEGEHRTRAERDADALIDLCRRALRDHTAPSTSAGRQRPGVNVVIDAADLAANELRQLGIHTDDAVDTFLDAPATTAAMRAWYRTGLARLRQPGGGSARTLTGHDLSPALAAAFACDAPMRRVVTVGSEILDLGRAAPTLPRSVRDAVLVRDRRCRFRGCDRTIDWCEVHHVTHRAHDGPDALGNCVLLCARHHHVLHRDGWRCRLDPDGTLTVTEPDGRRWATHPPGPGNRPPPTPPMTLGA